MITYNVKLYWSFGVKVASYLPISLRSEVQGQQQNSSLMLAGIQCFWNTFQQGRPLLKREVEPVLQLKDDLSEHDPTLLFKKRLCCLALILCGCWMSVVDIRATCKIVWGDRTQRLSLPPNLLVRTTARRVQRCNPTLW